MTDDPKMIESHRRRDDERAELLGHLHAMFEPAMAALGFVFLVLLLVDYGAVELGGRGKQWVGQGLQAIWAIFLLDFAARFFVAPSKRRYLRQNWLGAASLILPFLRPLRAFKAARALRSISLVRLIGGLNRGMRVLREVTRGRQVAYVGGLTVVVVIAGAVGVRFFDRGVRDAPIQSFPVALWWSAAMVTTINNELYAVSTEARVIAIPQRLYAVSMFGFVTASIASYLVGSVARDDPGELAGLRREIAALRAELRAGGPSMPAGGGLPGSGRGPRSGGGGEER